MKRLTASAAAVLLAGTLAANADPTYLRCDFKDHKGTRPSEGAIDLTLNEAKGTVETRVLSFDSYTDNGYFGTNNIEFDARNRNSDGPRSDNRLGGGQRPEQRQGLQAPINVSANRTE